MIAEAGRALYGERYHTQLAAALAVSPRVVRRWEAGTMPVPAGVWRDLYSLLSSRHRLLRRLVSDAMGHMEDQHEPLS